MKLYVARSISGYSFEQVVSYYEMVIRDLKEWYEIFCPMTGKGFLRNELKFKAEGYGTSISTNHAIFERDKWMISQTDIILTDLMDTDHVSIGCVMELAWASLLGKYTIVIMEKENIHNHAFILEAADIIFENYYDAIEYLKKLANVELRR